MGNAKQKFKFRKLDRIGTADAENDSMLASCFVDTGELDTLRDCSDPRRVVLARTGAGKSALLLRLEQVEERCIRLSPRDVALSHITNSTILRYVETLGVNLNAFFRLLWRHVLAVELLRHRFDLNSKAAFSDWIERMVSPQQFKKRQRAMSYLRRWSDEFWKETDYRTIELTRKLEEELSASLKAKVGPLETAADAKNKLAEEERVEVVNRAQSVVNRLQVKELNEVIEVIDDLFTDPQKRYYITIDALDDQWAEDPLRYWLIKALIEASRDFSRVRHVKVIIALRDDLTERVLRHTRDSGFQRDKFESLVLPLTWNRKNLEEVVDKRVSELVRRRYEQSEPVRLQDLVTKKVGKSEQPIPYILDRTRERPRDAIAFVNDLIRHADGKAMINSQIIFEAERDYSKSRLDSVYDEWQSDFAFLPTVATAILTGRPHIFNVADITQTHLEALWNTLAEKQNRRGARCEVANAAQEYFDGHINAHQFRSAILAALFRAGLIGIKATSHEPVTYCLSRTIELEFAELHKATKLYVHKTFWRGLGIVPNKR
jgi:hypothetical protein